MRKPYILWSGVGSILVFFYFINQEGRLIMETKLFDILVYNRSAEEFNEYWNKKYGKILETHYSGDELKEKIAICKEANRPATNWKFQNVIGYISIFAHGYSLFSKLSIDVREKKYIEGKPDIRYDPSTFFGLYVKEEITSEQIIDEFNDLLQCSIKERLPKRYVDLEAWNNTAKLIDWHELFYPKQEETEEDNRSKEEKIRERYELLFGTDVQMPPDVDF